MLALVPKIMCLIDSATTYTILKSNKFFSCLIMRDINVSIIYSTTNIILINQMEALITSLVMRVLKQNHIDIYVYMRNECWH